MSEYVDVDIIENGKVIGTTKILKKTEEPEEQKIKLEKVDDKTAYENLLVKYAELTRDRDYYSDALDKQVEATLKLYKEYAELKEKYNKVDIIGYDALKNLTKAENIIRELLFHLTNDTFYVTFETREQSVERARQFLQRR